MSTSPSETGGAVAPFRLSASTAAALTHDAHAYGDALGAFIAASPSSFHAASTVAAVLADNGFVLLAETQPWTSPAGRWVVVRDGAVIAWIVPEDAAPDTAVAVVGTHTDSPGFKLKPQPSLSAHGWLQAGVEVYGGPLLVSWLDRELELAGRVVGTDGREHLVRTGPYLRIPNLAIHLDRSAGETLTLDRQRHTQPVYGVGDVGVGDIVGLLGDLAGIPASEVGGYDMVTVDSQAPARFGAGGDLLAAPRLDNLSSVFAGLVALLAAEQGDSITMLAAFDHEEVGSGTRSGAAGPFLSDVLDRIYAGLGASRDDRARAAAASWHVSADAGHVVHPNYPAKHDPVVAPVPGGGPLLKINANQRYATDAYGAAMVAAIARGGAIDYQEFVSNNDVPCGSTIGPLTATRLGIRTVDVGVGLLSMHSARELVHVADASGLARLLTRFLAQQL